MATLNTVTVGGFHTYDPPGEVAINRFVMRTGASRYGRGVFAMLRRDYDQLAADTKKVAGKTTLVMKGDRGPGLTMSVILAGAEPMSTVVGAEAIDDLMKVTVYDLRSTGFTPLKKFYNVTLDGFPLDGSNKPICYASTLTSGSPYGWSTIISTLTSAGSVPNSIPTWNPYNLIWDNIPLANAIDDVAARLFYVVGFDHQNDSFTQSLDLLPPYQSALGVETQDAGYAANATLLEQVVTKGALLSGAVPGTTHGAERNANRLPGQIQVVFPGIGTADPYDTHRIYTKVLNTGFGTSDYVVPLTIGEYYGVWSGSAWVNQTDMDAMATDLAARAAVFMSQAFGQAEFGGIWPFRPDGRIRQVEWYSDARGARTVIKSDNAKDWLPTDALDDPVNLNANQDVVALGTGKSFVNPGGTKFVAGTRPPLFKLTGNGTAGGLYTANPWNPPTSTINQAAASLAYSDLGSAASQTVYLMNSREVGATTHILSVAADPPLIFFGFYIGIAADGKAVFLIDECQ